MESPNVPRLRGKCGPPAGQHALMLFLHTSMNHGKTTSEAAMSSLSLPVLKKCRHKYPPPPALRSSCSATLVTLSSAL